MAYIDNINNNFDNPITKPIIDALEIEENILNECIESTLNQFYVDSATYGLDYWEMMLGISKNNFDIQTRRENIKAKMRSRGTTNIEVIKNICEAYSNGEVDVIVNHSNYSFVIKFVGSIGIPQAFDELDKTIENIKPCHLAHSYEFTYNAHNKLSKFTHEELSRFTHEQLRNSQTLENEVI